jgi:replicative DNA helicase
MHNCTGGGDIEYDLDVALVLSKDWIASRELEELLESGCRARTKPPRVDIVELHVDKNRDAPVEVSPSIQYAFFVHENKFVELEYKTEEQDRPDFRGFAKAQEIDAFLIEKGHLEARLPLA